MNELYWNRIEPRARRMVVLAVLSLLGGADRLNAQQAAEATDTLRLTLQDAIALGRRSNPEYRSAVNDQAGADWGVRAAYGSLLPSVSSNVGLSYLASGTPRIGLFSSENIGVGKTPEFYFSDYSLNLSLQLDAGTPFRVAEARANRRAVDARVDAAEFTMATAVTRQYLTALRAQDQLELAEQDLERADENYRLAQARVQVGAASPLDSLQAAVERGRAEVARLQARTQTQTEKRRLVERTGVQQTRPLQLTSEFPVFDPPWSEAGLLEEALQRSPDLRASRAAAAAAKASARTATTRYLPSVRLFASLQGSTQEVGDPDALLAGVRSSAENAIENCRFWNRVSAGLSAPLPDRPANCDALALTPEKERLVLERNSVFPFDFTREPLYAGVTVSLPIFQGFTRERDRELAAAASDDARHQSRAVELRLRTEVGATLDALEAGHMAVQIERKNVELATEQFRLAQERYRLGAAPFLELAQAQTELARASQALLNAIYTFNENLVALEALVGRELRGAN